MKMRNTMRALLGALLLTITLSGCDYRVCCRFVNKTDDTLRVVCFRTAEVPPLDSVGSAIDQSSRTGGCFFGVNKDKDNLLYLHLNDSVVYFDIPPQESFFSNLPMNYFWGDERIQEYLRYIKRLEICMPQDTLTYSGEQELNELFQDRKISKHEIRVNIREKGLLNPLLDFVDSW